MKKIKLLYIFIILFGYQYLYCQNISVTFIEQPVVCQSNKIQVTIANTQGNELPENTLSLELPCGFEYVLGTISSNFQEKNVTDLSNPSFTSPKISSGATTTMTLSIRLNCDASACFDDKETFIIKGIYNNQNLAFHSDPVNIEVPELVISEVNSVYMEIPSFSTKIRQITIANSRAGKLSEFLLQIKHDHYLEVSTDVGKVISSNPEFLILRFDGSDFTKVGNKDSYLDINEKILVNESIFANVCSYDVSYTRSEYTASWGCFDKICHQNSVIANVKIIPNEDIGPKLTFSVKSSEPDCYENGTALQSITILELPHVVPLANSKFEITQSHSNRGIVLNSIQTNYTNNIQYLDTFTNACGQILARRVVITKNYLELSNNTKQYTLNFLTGFCEEVDCLNKENAYLIKHTYQKICSKPDDSNFSFSYQENVDYLPAFKVQLSLFSKDTTLIPTNLGPPSLNNTSEGFIHVKLSDVRLESDKDDTLTLTFTIPSGIILENPDFIINHNKPFSIVMNGNTYIVKYLLPLSDNIVTFLLPFHFDCNQVVPPTDCEAFYASCYCRLPKLVDEITLRATIKIDEECKISDSAKGCDELAYVIDCDNIVPCYQDTIPISFKYEAILQRTTLGKPDPNNDGVADPDSIPDVSKYRLTHFIPGDTFNLVFKGKIITDIPGSKAKVLVLKESYTQRSANSDVTLNIYNDLLFGDMNALKTIYSLIKIFQQNTGKTYIFSHIPEFSIDQNRFYYLAADSLNYYHGSNSLPSDFQFADGDSIFIEIQKHFDFSVFQANKQDIKQGQTYSFTYKFDQLMGNENVDLQHFVSPCDCYNFGMLIPPFQMTNIGISINSIVQAKTLCTDQFYNIQILNLTYGHFKDLPLPIGTIFPYEVRESIKPIKLELEKNADIDFGDVQFLYLGKSFSISPDFQGNKVIYSLDMATFPPAGAYAPQSAKDILRVYLDVKPKTCLNKIPALSTPLNLYFHLNKIGKLYFPDSIKTTLNITFPKPNIDVFLFQKEISAFSNDFSTSFSLNGLSNLNNLDHVYIRFTNPSGNITTLTLQDTTSKEIYSPSPNGYFQIGALKKQENRYFTLSGLSNGCNDEIIFVEYGYDCSPHADPAVSPCFDKVDTLLIHFPSGLMDILIDTTEQQELLLCDTIEKKITVYNAGLGHAKDINLTLDLPSGFHLISGSTIIYYPAGQRLQKFTLPAPDFTNFGKLGWYLKNHWPVHAISGLAGAGMIPDNAFDFAFTIETSCDIISGLPIGYHVNAKNGCDKIVNDITRYSPALTIKDPTTIEEIPIKASSAFLDICRRDSVKISIVVDPNTVTSHSIGCKLPSSWRLVTNSIKGNLPNLSENEDNGVYWWLSTNPSVQTVLEFIIINISDTYCFEDELQIFTFLPSSAICFTTGNPCSISTIAGFTKIPLQIEMPDYQLIENSIELSNGSVSLNSSLKKLSGQGKNSVEAYIILDKNNNGEYDLGDQILDTILYSGFDLNDTVNLIHNLKNTNLTDVLCQMSLYIPSETNCVCGPSIIPLNKNINIIQDKIRMCNETSIQLGIPNSPGSKYQWNDGTGLSCHNCSMTTFTGVNTSENIQNIQKILQVENAEGCIFSYYFDIEISHQLILSVHDINICYGDTIGVLATQAADYQWFGPNILQNNQQELLANPVQNAKYFCIMKDRNGCENSDSVLVKVVLPPQYIIESDSQFCNNVSPQLNISANNFSYFQWINGANFLSDPYSLSPLILVQSDFIYKLELRNESCKEIINIPVKFVSAISKSKDITICRGETYIFETDTLHQSGKYCKTFTSQFNCDSIICINLTFSDIDIFNPILDTISKTENTDLQISAPPGFTSYFWVPSTALNCDDCSDVNTTINDTITYHVFMENEFGCKTEKRYFIKIKPICVGENVKLPNAFTPNGDTWNDFYSLGNVESCGPMHFKVYNRWGNLVYEAVEWDNHWDGRSKNGESLPQSTYFIEVEFTDTGTIKNSMLDLRIK
ncbi:MAG: gliding motility-associated C-terminal domain-containing protein [Saprospiraceae bacterium]